MLVHSALGFVVAGLVASAANAIAASSALHRPASKASEDTARFVEAIASIRSSTSPSFSPDGTSIAYVSDVTGMPQVWVMAVDAPHSAKRLTQSAHPVQTVHWSPKGDFLAYDVARDGNSHVEVYVASLGGTHPRRVFPAKASFAHLVGWTADGQLLQIGSNFSNPAGLDALLVDVGSGTVRLVASGGINSITDVTTDGRFAVVARWNDGADNNLYLVDRERQTEHLLTPHAGSAMSLWGKLSPDGRRVYMITNADRDLGAFAVAELEPGGRLRRMTTLSERADAEAENAVLSPDGRHAALVWNVGGRSELELLDVETGVRSRGPNLPFEYIQDLEFAPDGRRLAIVGRGATTPTNIFTWNVPAGPLVQRTRSAHNGVDLAALVRPELVAYRGHDGLKLSGWLYRPRGSRGPGPVVFNYHGGPAGQARPWMNDATQALVSAGISVFAPNVRGSTGFGKHFASLDDGPLRRNAVRDIEATAQALIAAGIADPARLGIMGESYGGYMVMAGITHYPNMFAAAVNQFGIVNFETYFANTDPLTRAWTIAEYGDPATDSALLRELSPIHRLDLVTTPLLILHGAEDRNVPVNEAEQIVRALRNQRAEVRFILFPDEGHGWRKVENRARSSVEIVDFFSERLLQAPHP